MSEPATGPVADTPVCYRHPDRETWIRCQRCDRPICPDCMHSAAVGFQCPSCVKEGSKATRSGRLPYGGSHAANPALTSIGLIVVNLAVWAAIAADGGNGSGLVDRLALLPQTTLFGSPDGTTTLVEGVSGGAWWQLATSAFSHVAIWHLGLNMMALYFLGPQLESILGRGRFLAVYLLSALCGSTAVLWLSGEHSQTLGASGAIFGLMGALLVVAWKVKADVSQLLFWIGLNVVFTVTASSFISWQGHFGGLAGGALLAGIVVFAPKRHRTAFQVVGLSVVTLACVVLILVRVAALA